MKEENKYYTPTTEEFHVGFEYEAYNSNDWFFHEASAGWVKIPFHPIVKECSLLKVGWAIEKGWIRVKALDREDIESLGFEFKPYGDIENYELGDWSLQTFQHPKHQIRITHRVGSTRFFNGDIKNKSELKRILKQIGV